MRPLGRQLSTAGTGIGSTKGVRNIVHCNEGKGSGVVVVVVGGGLGGLGWWRGWVGFGALQGPESFFFIRNEGLEPLHGYTSIKTSLDCTKTMTSLSVQVLKQND